MPRFLITETCQHSIEAESEEAALALWLADESNAQFIGVTEREIEEQAQ